MTGPAPTTTFEHTCGRSFTFIGTNPSEYIFQRIVRERDFYESDLLQVLQYIGFRANSTALDVGANIGNHTVFFAAVLSLRVTAFEPEPENYRLLRLNCNNNTDAGDVTLLNLAIGETRALVDLFQVHPGNSGTFKTIPSTNGKFPVERLDDVVATDTDVSLIKIDTEGDELGVLQGATVTLERSRPTICIEAHGGKQFTTIDNFLSLHGFRCLAIEGRSETYIYLPHRSPDEVVRFNRTSSLLALRESRAVGRVVGGLALTATTNETTLRTVDEKVSSLVAEFTATTERLAKAELELKQSRSQLASLTTSSAKSETALQTWRAHYNRVQRSRPLHWGWRARWILAKVFRRPLPSPIMTDKEIVASQ